MIKFKKIVILDEIKMNEKQKRKLELLTEKLVVYNDTPTNEFEAISRIGDADVVITSWTTISKKILNNCPKLKYIGVWATGYSWIDVKTASKRGIIVTNVPGYATESVAELVIGQLISLLRKTKTADSICRQGKFDRSSCLGEELAGKTIGIIGLGKIGSRVAEIAKAFNMNVVYYSKTKKPNVPYEYMELDNLLRCADVVSLHASFGGEIITPQRIKLLKKGALVINFGIAGAVNEYALIEELKAGRLRAILDHYENHEIKQAFRDAGENVLLTPEIGFYTKQALEKLTDICVYNLISFLNGKPTNIVS